MTPEIWSLDDGQDDWWSGRKDRKERWGIVFGAMKGCKSFDRMTGAVLPPGTPRSGLKSAAFGPRLATGAQGSRIPGPPSPGGTRSRRAVAV